MPWASILIVSCYIQRLCLSQLCPFSLNFSKIRIESNVPPALRRSNTHRHFHKPLIQMMLFSCIGLPISNPSTNPQLSPKLRRGNTHRHIFQGRIHNTRCWPVVNHQSLPVTPASSPPALKPTSWPFGKGNTHSHLTGTTQVYHLCQASVDAQYVSSTKNQGSRSLTSQSFSIKLMERSARNNIDGHAVSQSSTNDLVSKFLLHTVNQLIRPTLEPGSFLDTQAPLKFGNVVTRASNLQTASCQTRAHITLGGLKLFRRMNIKDVLLLLDVGTILLDIVLDVTLLLADHLDVEELTKMFFRKIQLFINFLIEKCVFWL